MPKRYITKKCPKYFQHILFAPNLSKLDDIMLVAFLKQLFFTKQKSLGLTSTWIGANDIDVDGQFVWDKTKEKLNYFRDQCYSTF